MREKLVFSRASAPGQTIRTILGDSSVDPEVLAEAISKFTDISEISLRGMPPIKPEILGLTPPELIGQRGVLPLGVHDDVILYVGFLDPLDRKARRLVSFYAGMPVRPFVLSATDFAAALENAAGESWDNSWEELLGQYRLQKTNREPKEDSYKSSMNPELVEEVQQAILGGKGQADFPLWKEGTAHTRGRVLSRYYAPPPPDNAPTEREEFDPNEDGGVDLRAVFRQASRPGGYRSVQSHSFKALSEHDGQPRAVDGFLGLPQAQLKRSKERDPAASQIFRLAADSARTARTDSQFCSEFAETLHIIYPITAIWLLRNSSLMLAEACSEVADVDDFIHRSFLIEPDSPWEKVVRNGQAYRGRVLPTDAISSWLYERSANHMWLAPFFVKERLLFFVSVCMTQERKMTLPDIDAFEYVGKTISQFGSASSACLPEQIIMESS